MSWIANTVTAIDNVIEFIGKSIAWLTLLMVMLSFAIVLFRYAFNLGWIALQESMLYFHGIVFMLGAAFTLKADGHVRVDIFYQKFSDVQKAWVNLLGTLLLLLPVCFTIFILSFDYVLASWSILEKSGEAGGLPLVYLNKTLLLLIASTLILQGIAEIGRNILVLKAAKQGNV